MKRYVIRRRPDDLEDVAAWRGADVAVVEAFRPESTDHRPATEARLLYDNSGLHGCFRVHDRFVRSVCTVPNGPVHLDSCVEFFVQPRPACGYFNFEFNAGGALHVSYITDPTRIPGGFKERRFLDPALQRAVRVSSTLPPRVEPERTESTDWEIVFRIPFAVLESQVGPLGRLSGQTWRGNFFKCGDATSHPHWASWAPVPEKNFHMPTHFGALVLD